MIKTIVQGSYQTNSYVVRKDESRKDCVIIDTGLDNFQLLQYLSENSLNPIAVILTHGHLDHILGVDELRVKHPEIKVYIHEDDADMLLDAEKNMSKMSAIYADFSTKPADFMLKDGEDINIADLSLKVIHVPGHTPGGICLYYKEEDVIFSGDCVFAGSIGRTDFPGYQEGKCFMQLIKGIKEKVLTLPEETKLLPGHGPATTIRCELKHNPYLNDESLPY